jgi:hypothetical protein
MRPGSAIINTTPMNADEPGPQPLAYAATKGTIQNFTGGLRSSSPTAASAPMRWLPARSGRRSSPRPLRDANPAFQPPALMRGGPMPAAFMA